MSAVNPISKSSGLLVRVRELLLRPNQAWATIDVEPTTIGAIYRRHVLPLAAIGPVASFIGLMIFGLGVPGLVTIRVSPVWLSVQMAVSYGLSLVACYVLALVIEGLATTFDGVKARVQAFKLAAYASTAVWLAGVFAVVPQLTWLVLLGAIYSVVLLHKGLPVLMRTPPEKGSAYTAVVAVFAVAANLLIGMAAAAVLSMSGGMSAAAFGTAKVNLPQRQGSVDLGKLQEASRRIEAAAKSVENGQAPPPTDTEALKGYLPETVGGFVRQEVRGAMGGVAGLEGSQAEAHYAKGDARLTLKVTDIGQAGALAGLASALNAERAKETPTGYEKMGIVDGRVTRESYDREARRGEYSVLVGERFMVEADGSGLTIADLKSAVAAVDFGRLEAAAKAN